MYLFDDKIAIYYNLFGVEQVSFIEVLEDIERLENEQEIDHTNSLQNVFLYNSPRPAKCILHKTVHCQSSNGRSCLIYGGNGF